MLHFNQIKKHIYLAVCLVSLSVTNAQGNVEISGHFGMNFGSTLNLDEIVRESQDWDIDQKIEPFILEKTSFIGS